ncbi:cytidylyltransferase domain-containing protein [Desulfotignum phosphitoxidans]|nr:glycosyltransferase family protein [Desulfotignum phosphitoxidans]
MINLLIIIQARMTSTRLPGKVMLPLCGKTVLEIMLDRLKNFKKNIIIATTNDGTQKPIVDVCKKNHIPYYEGDTENVLSRYYETACKFGAKSGDIIVRLTSDCPLADQDIAQRTIDLYKNNHLDLAGAGPHSGFPRGIDTVAYGFDFLKFMYNNASTPYEKEHVTIHPDKIKKPFKTLHLNNQTDDSHYRLTLDEIKDYDAIKEVYKKFNCSTEFTYDELIKMLKKNPYIYEINKEVKQKEYEIK